MKPKVDDLFFKCKMIYKSFFVLYIFSTNLQGKKNTDADKSMKNPTVLFSDLKKECD